MPPISRVFVANRGEIALRIVTACRELGLESVLGVSDPDRASLAARAADRVVCIGPARATDSYLRVDTLVWAAKKTGCEALHPGYGFLSERYELAEACERNGLIFIGPSPECIRDMGNKLLARRIAQASGIPVIPGSGELANVDEALHAAREVGLPVMLKAAAGGGGRGMKVVSNEGDLRSAFQVASAEAGEAFGNGALYLEHLVPRARHVEVQVAGDSGGNVIHLGERDCSIQRRYQKVVEETPAYALSGRTRQAIRDAAVALAGRIRYESLGTVEFVYDDEADRFYFLEMNTRVQVEHPVTEMVTGIDLIKEQLRLALGGKLSVSQADLRLEGASIECRITAEDPYANFQPSPGRISRWAPPGGPGVRLDSHCHEGHVVSPYYDSLIGKLITWGPSRGDALARMRQALDDMLIEGIETNLPFLRQVVREPDYVAGRVHTKWLEGLLAQGAGTSVSP